MSIQKIASSTFLATKSKEETFKSLLKIIEKNPDIIDDNLGDFAQLYHYFTPSIPKKPKNVFNWISLAKGKNDVRFYLNYVYCDLENIVASDGHRLHLSNNSLNLDPGYYNEAMHSVEVDGKFPDYNRLIPDVSKNHIKTSISDLTQDLDNDTKTKTHIMVFDNGEIKVCLNKKYFDDAVAFLDMDVFVSSGDNPVVFKSKEKSSLEKFTEDGDNNLIAIIMPLRD